MKRIITKIGDVFAVKIDDVNKKYFQYIANDLTQLNSSVIRAFKKKYALEETPTLKEIVNDEIDFYAHVVLKWGLKMGLWDKVGNINEIGKIDDILFRDSHDYGSGAKANISDNGKIEVVFKNTAGEKVKTSHDWYVWKIGEDFKDIGTLTKEYQNAEIGIVVNPNAIIDRMRTGEYHFVYPSY